jgi:hypothetical protein
MPKIRKGGAAEIGTLQGVAMHTLGVVVPPP